jgi:hypothetical protein
MKFLRLVGRIFVWVVIVVVILATLCLFVGSILSMLMSGFTLGLLFWAVAAVVLFCFEFAGAVRYSSYTEDNQIFW